ncbi:arrestin domain-containing protein 3 [Exaiptasia diaphana]|uniref:Arrestin C-terminal-like domain-containing protein n=1 Tax=Exaiptasia diaphana TaxID=2652724 RepID=A0A913Y7N6_EXADI|nr:arrestin domain-containing protein 3 [Exaiptasia diaphana]KXJ28869.1 Arrestin domain-containing protein 3 [Exaiptasia diaphana]
MMKKRLSFSINLNRKSRIYHPGEVVAGECVIGLKETLKFRSVRIEFVGEARTNWDEMENYTTTHKDEEIYFHKKTSLLASGQNKGAHSHLNPGRHVLDFTFKIPPFSLPSSFESKQGYVRYFLRARIDRPWRFDEITKETIHIIDLIDANSPRMLMPVFGEAQKSLNCLRNGTAAPLQMLVSTDRNAYCPGERIVVTTEIRHLPFTEKYQTIINLIQTVTYKSQSKYRSEYKRLKLLQRSALSSKVDELVVPDVVPSMRNCGIVSITYQLKVIVARAHHHDTGLDLEVDLPITIATVPLRKSHGMINKIVPFSDLNNLLNNKTFVTIKHMSEVNLYSMSAVAT